ncbi:MAG: hypothetical protein ACUVSX_05670 [Aggregatilineales bacterium]
MSSSQSAQAAAVWAALFVVLVLGAASWSAAAQPPAPAPILLVTNDSAPHQFGRYLG